MAILDTPTLLGKDLSLNGGGPFYVVSTRTTEVDMSNSMLGGGPFYTPHYVSGGTPPATYNATQFFIMF